MPSGSPARTNKPLTIEPTRKFMPVKLNIARFDNAWERKRGRQSG
jgi:hypothetical protein